ncbi:L-fuculokinase [Oceanobacillus sp. CFH 90083]|uniref:FGGY-family carbohydrate kinase n=1 Tax=Oceanobacillus sp. CFH 90083 TaxID=2592336 RepID=UPI00128D8441|nr:FGGY family carbohydrate kinase [Oceanobacillus sp. CFH 90083]
MGKEMYIVSIDVGTTNTKVCLYELPAFRLIEIEKFATPQTFENGKTDIDAEQIWREVLQALKNICNRLEDSQQIKQITVSSFAQTIVLQDSQGEVITPTIAWFDPRTKREAEEVNDSFGEEKLYHRTGINAHSNQSLTKLLWLRRYKKSAFQRMHKWTCMSGFIASRLTGIYATDWSLASRTLLFDIGKKKWAAKLIKTFDLDKKTFPELVESGAAIAAVKDSVSKETGLSKDVTISISGHDHMAGSISTGLKKKTEILNSTGTTEGLLLLGEKPNLSDTFRKFAISNGCYVIDSEYTLYGSMPTAGQSFNWIAKAFNRDLTDIAEMCHQVHEEYVSDFASIMDRMQVFIPHLRGSGPPIRNSASKVMIYGATDQSTDHDMLFSMIAGLCFELKQLKNVYETYVESNIQRIKVIGPAVKNPLWLQLKADILQSDILAYEIEEAVAKGGAMLSASKQGLVDTLPEPEIKIYTPNKDRAEVLDDFYKKFYLPLYHLKNHFEDKE